MVRFAQIVKRIRREELDLAIEERRARSDEGLPAALAPPPDWQVMGLPGGAPHMATALAEQPEVARPAAPRPPAPKAAALPRTPAAPPVGPAALAAAPAAAAVKDDDFLQSLDALARPKAAGSTAASSAQPAREKVEDTSVVDSLLDEMVAEEPSSEESPAQDFAPAADEPESMDDILARMSAGDEDDKPVEAPPQASAPPQAARPQAAKQAAAAHVEPAAPAEPEDLGGLEDEWAAALGEEGAAPAKDDSLAGLEQQLAANAEAVQVGSDSQGAAKAEPVAKAEDTPEDDPFADLKVELDADTVASTSGDAGSTDDLLASLGVGAEAGQAAAADDPFAALDAELGGSPPPVAEPAKPASAGGVDDLSDLLGAASDPDGPGVGAQEAEALKEEMPKEDLIDRELEKSGAAVGSPEDLFAGEPEDIGALLGGDGGTATAEAEPQGDGLDDLFASTPEDEPAPLDDEEPEEPPKPKADPNSPEAFASPEDIFG